MILEIIVVLTLLLDGQVRRTPAIPRYSILLRHAQVVAVIGARGGGPALAGVSVEVEVDAADGLAEGVAGLRAPDAELGPDAAAEGELLQADVARRVWGNGEIYFFIVLRT